MISVSNLCKSFDGLDVLKGISVEIDKGDVICVIGPSGSGKSTFLRCLNLLEQPTSGSIVLKAAILRTVRSTSTSTVRRWAWCSSSSISFRI